MCSIRLPRSKNVKISTTKRHNSTPTLLKTQYKKCLPSKPRLLFRSLPPRKRKNVKRKPRECSRASLPRWISNYISCECLFLRCGRWMEFRSLPAQKICFLRKERVRARVVSKRAKTTGRQRYIHLHPPNVSLQSRVAVRVVRKPARIRDIIRDENLFFFISCFLPQSLVSAPKDTQKLRRDFTPEETKEKGTCCFLLFNNNNTRETVRFFFSN